MQERDVLADELLLQADGVRGDDDASLGGGTGGLDRRHEIREALADAGARLDHQVPRAAQGVGDGVGHAQLLGPRLVIRQAPGDCAVRA